MIRRATAADIPRLVEMGQRFRRESEYSALLADNPEQIAALCHQLVSHPSGGAFVAEKDGRVIGMIGYIVYNHLMSGEKVAGEVAWWVEPEARGDGLRLMRAAEDEARKAGAVQMQMIAPNERVGALYQRLGYRVMETTYVRTL